MKLSIQTGKENTLLRSRATEISSAELRDILPTGKAMMKWLGAKDNGAGLAAPQVGLSKRMIVVNLYEEEDGELHTIQSILMINPVIREFSTEVELDEEGCFSCPDEYGRVSRPRDILVEYRDVRYTLKKLRLSGFSARVVQHEIDHLDGILFTDKVIGEMIFEKEV